MFLFKLLVSSLLSFFILLLLKLIYRSTHSSQEHENPPPSPWKLPIIGNLHQLSGNQRSLGRLAKKHGPLMLLHLGSVPVLIASSANAAREILKNHEPMFLDRLASTNIRKITYNFKDVTFSPYGEHWTHAKRIVVHHLLSHKKVLSYKKVREEEVTLVMDIIKESCGSLVNFSELLISHTNNVFCRVALGRKFERKKVKSLIELSVVMTVLIRFEDYMPCLSWIDKLRGLDSTLENHLKKIDEFLEGMIEEHLHKSYIVDEEERFIDVLLEHKEDDDTTSFHFQRDDIKALLLDSFVAGTVQPFSTLEWALSELLRNPKTMKKLQEEIREFAQGKPKVIEEDLAKLEYLNAVFKETMRLHPSPPLIPRELTRDISLMGEIRPAMELTRIKYCLMGYDIKCGTKVFINTWAIGRDPTLWDEPGVFKPERFLSSPIDYYGAYFELIPFGSGRRICPGIQYSKAINEITLANLVYKFDLALPNGEKPKDLDMSESSGALIHRKNNLFLVPTSSSF
ncbi:cytochrome P450 Tp4149-like [Rutidosis leptorrhynchoides]|uniref:cytochrome P450 Tp4149-like n=1 Tax=Rutidosis leptorrhynchoides TaxID=125765 RepID=UPI003A98E67B